MDRSERSHGYFLIAFAFWILVGLFAFIKINIDPDSMAYLGQFGDFFGFFTSLITLLTAFAAYRALHGQLAASNDQKKQFLDQQIYQEKLVLSEKLEKLIIELRQYHEAIFAYIEPSSRGTSLNRGDPLVKLLTQRHGCRSSLRTQLSLYFPSLKVRFEDFDKITTKSFKDLSEGTSTDKAIHDDLYLAIERCVDLINSITEDAAKVIKDNLPAPPPPHT
jgi:hypothetical protein